MSPDDPRHGTQAGAIAHRRAGEPACLPCRTADLRSKKAGWVRREHGVRNRIPLGQRAYDVLVHVGCTPVAEATGLWRNNLYKTMRRGPDAIVLRATRDAILGVAGPTPTGIQRRVRALTVLGWTLDDIAARASVTSEGIARMSRADAPPSRVHPGNAARLIAAYDELRRETPPDDRYAVRRRSESTARGWLPPNVWDDIDDPHENPLAESDAEIVDDVIVERLMAGFRVASSRAEKEEAMRRHLAAGGSERDLCLRHGWKTGRYVVRQDGAA